MLLKSTLLNSVWQALSAFKKMKHNVSLLSSFKDIGTDLPVVKYSLKVDWD